MPFNVKKSGSGFKVFSPNGAKSKKPMSKDKARKQQAAIYANWKGESVDRDFMSRLDEALGLDVLNEKKDWIKGAIKKPGALHKQLGVPEDKKIPAKKLDAAAQKGGKLGERARLAKTLKGLNK